MRICKHKKSVKRADLFSGLCKRAGVCILAISLLASIGCTSLNHNQAAEIEEKLHAKYGIDFTVTAIGDRIGTGSVKAYCSPSDDKSLVFEARMKNSDSSLFDTYVPRLIGREVEELIKKQFAEAGITVEVFAELSGVDYSVFGAKEIKLSDFLSDYEPTGFTSDIIMESSCAEDTGIGEKLVSIYFGIYEQLNVKFASEIHLISDDEFEKCCEKLQKSPTLNDTFFMDYSVSNTFLLSCEENKVSKSEEEINSIIHVE